MKAPERGARLTISASAAREFFDPERTKGLRIRVADDTIELKASGTRGGADVIPVEFRTRGGLAATIDPGGTHAPDLFRSLRRAGYSENAPFFVLTESARGWVGLDHHRSRHPPLNKPHMRLWMSSGAGGRAGGARQRQEAVERPKRKQRTQVQRRPAQKRGDGRRRLAQSEIDWGQFSRSILKARKLMDRPPPVRRRQDSEMALERAKDDLEQFRRLAEEVLGLEHADQDSSEHLQAEHDSAVSEVASLREEMTVLRDEITNLRGALDEAQEQREVAEEALRNITRQSQRAEEALHPGQRRRGGRRIRMPEPVAQFQDLDEGVDHDMAQEPAEDAAASKPEHPDVQETEQDGAHEQEAHEEAAHQEEDHEAADHNEPEGQAGGEQDEQPPTEEVEFPPKEEC